MSIYKFYGVNIETPLSLAHNTSQWNTSVIGQLNAKTDGQVFIREIPAGSRTASYGWRVVDAYYSDEDVTMTYFRAFGLNGEPLPQATFGVHWDSVPKHISGTFKYQPEFGNRYYVPAQNNMHTPNTGGYTVQVLDMDYPSEGLSFGLFKQGEQHQGLIISFRLFQLQAGYPNDLSMTPR
ncbi:MAG: hypothetical protein Kow0031_02020 [Anaerolineae bacterium]